MQVKNAALRRFSTPTPHATVQYWKKCDEEKLLDTPLLVTSNEADEGDDLRLLAKLGLRTAAPQPAGEL